MVRILKPLWSVAKANVWEALGVIGLACLLAGCWQVWAPLPWIVGGLLVLTLGLWGAWAAATAEAARKAQQR